MSIQIHVYMYKYVTNKPQKFALLPYNNDNDYLHLKLYIKLAVKLNQIYLGYLLVFNFQLLT